MADYILVFNPGSTSTRVALFDGDDKISEEVFRHDPEELGKFDNVADQFEYRMRVIDHWLESHREKIDRLRAVVGRGATALAAV